MISEQDIFVIADGEFETIRLKFFDGKVSFTPENYPNLVVVTDINEFERGLDRTIYKIEDYLGVYDDRSD